MYLCRPTIFVCASVCWEKRRHLPWKFRLFVSPPYIFRALFDESCLLAVVSMLMLQLYWGGNLCMKLLWILWFCFGSGGAWIEVSQSHVALVIHVEKQVFHSHSWSQVRTWARWINTWVPVLAPTIRTAWVDCRGAGLLPLAASVSGRGQGCHLLHFREKHRLLVVTSADNCFGLVLPWGIH